MGIVVGRRGDCKGGCVAGGGDLRTDVVVGGDIFEHLG